MDNPQSSLPSDSRIAQASTSHNPVYASNYDYQQYEPLYKAARSGDLDAAKKFLNDHPEAMRARITFTGETALHVAAMFGHLQIVEELVQLMSVDDVELVDSFNLSALHYATYTRNTTKIAECLVKKSTKLLTISAARGGWIPITLALDKGHTEMAPYLYSVTPFEVLLPENGDHGATLLSQCYFYKMFDIVLDLLERYPRLALTRSGGAHTFLDTLAMLPSAFPSGSQLRFWRRWIYKWINVHQEPAFAINEIPVSSPEINTRKNDYMRTTIPGLLHRLVSNTLKLLGMKNMYEAELAHKQYLEILRAACHVISTSSQKEVMENVLQSVVRAALRGNAEFIVETVKVQRPLLWTININNKERPIFFLAVEFRHAKLFSLIHGLVFKDVAASLRDKEGNHLLHMAGLLAPPTQLNHISGAVLQMQRELQWYKEVENVMPPMKRESLNFDNMSPRDLFTQNHKDLVKEGERWTKDTAGSCTVVAALVATITFAAAFTVPGGNDQNTGYPIFLHKKLFMLFIISDAVSLFSSSTSLLMFLGLLTSRYAEDDFLKSLPTKLIIGLSTMFISIATMMIAFCVALFIMLHDKSWIVIPVTLLASVPVTLYIWLQFPLLVEIFMSTYGPGIFDRNVEPWP